MSCTGGAPAGAFIRTFRKARSCQREPARPANRAVRRPIERSRWILKDVTLLGNSWAKDQKNQGRKASTGRMYSARAGQDASGGAAATIAISGRLVNGVERTRNAPPRVM